MIALTGVPVIATERLRLRAPELRDTEAMLAFQQSERFQFIDPDMDPEAGWRHWAAIIGHWVLRGFGLWTVTRHGSDETLGLIGCWEPKGWPEREIGWSLTAEAEGQGIGYEASVAARAYAYGSLGWTTAVSYIDPDNARSIRLAERLGAVRDPEAAVPPNDTPETCLVYRHPAPEQLA